MVRGVLLRHLHPHHSMWVVAVQGDLLATSTSTVAGEEHSIFIHSTTELARFEMIQFSSVDMIMKTGKEGRCGSGDWFVTQRKRLTPTLP